MKLKQFTMLLITIVIMYISNGFAEDIPVHFTGLKATNNWSVYVGTVRVNSLLAVDHEDEIAAFVEGNDGSDIMVGTCVYGDNNAGYFYLNVYADDVSTKGIKDGANEKDTLFFKIWDSSQNLEYVLHANNIKLVPEEGLVIPDDDLAFHTDNTFGLLQLSIIDIVQDGVVDLKDVIMLMKQLASH
ncbi:conserved hypothetical protein, secreted [Candidatus Magnetomorum sp. HK-1]|nr:conserved hypothetical protein, secreted [Candidatus Magnetomorum sp. HK-1]